MCGLCDINCVYIFKIRDQHEKKDTVEWLYEHVKKQVNVSHVSGYGDQVCVKLFLRNTLNFDTCKTTECCKCNLVKIFW